jgi:hypothetical protein
MATCTLMAEADEIGFASIVAALEGGTRRGTCRWHEPEQIAEAARQLDEPSPASLIAQRIRAASRDGIRSSSRDGRMNSSAGILFCTVPISSDSFEPDTSEPSSTRLSDTRAKAPAFARRYARQQLLSHRRSGCRAWSRGGGPILHWQELAWR